MQRIGFLLIIIIIITIISTERRPINDNSEILVIANSSFTFQYCIQALAKSNAVDSTTKNLKRRNKINDEV